MAIEYRQWNDRKVEIAEDIISKFETKLSRQNK